MAAVSIDIPTGATARIKAMVVKLGPVLAQQDPGITAVMPGGKAPDQWTNAEAMVVLRAMIRCFVLGLVKQVEAQAAADAARDAALAKVDADGLVT